MYELNAIILTLLLLALVGVSILLVGRLLLPFSWR